LVIVDRLTKQTILVPTHTTLSSLGVAKLLHDHVFKRVGILEKVIHDRGVEFVSKFMKEFAKMVGLEQGPSTAYHPQTDGQTERINAEVEKYL